MINYILKCYWKFKTWYLHYRIKRFFKKIPRQLNPKTIHTLLTESFGTVPADSLEDWERRFE